MQDEQLDKMIKAISILANSIEKGCKEIRNGLDNVSASIIELSEVMQEGERTFND